MRKIHTRTCVYVCMCVRGVKEIYFCSDVRDPVFFLRSIHQTSFVKNLIKVQFSVTFPMLKIGQQSS